MFPALDVLRVAVRTETVNSHFYGEKDGDDFLQLLMSIASPDGPPANVMLVLRTLVNSFLHGPGRAVLLAHRDYVVAAVAACKTGNKNIHIAMSSVLLNYAVAFNQAFDVEGKSQCLSAIAEVMDAVVDSEANFRLLVCVGTLITNDDNSIAIASSLGMSPGIGKLRAVTDPGKVGDCARYVFNIMNNLQDVGVNFR